MSDVNPEVLAFLIDIQEHGAQQLRALSTDFNTLGVAADRISKQLVSMQATLDQTATQAQVAGGKIASSAKSASAETSQQALANERLAKTQQAVTGDATKQAAATDKLATSQKGAAGAATTAAKAQTDAANATAAGTAAVTHQGRTYDEHGKKLDQHTKRLQKVKSISHDVAGTMNNLSLPIIATGGFAIKMGFDYEAAMSRLHTQAGYAERDVKKLEQEVLKAGPAMRRSPTELAEALYHVASVGVPASQALKVIEAASIGANIGQSNLQVTARGLVIVMKSLHQPATEARGDMALLNEIVGAGDMHMEELVSSLGKVLPQAKNFGLGLRDVGAAMDVLTSRGLDAGMVSTRLGMTFNLLGNPSVTAQKSLDQIGISSGQLAEDMRKPNGLLIAVSTLKDHLDKAFPPGRKLSVDEEKRALLIYKKSLEETGVSGKELTTDLKTYAATLEKTGSSAVLQAQTLSSAFGRGRQSATILSLVQNLNDLRKTYNRLPEGSKALKKLTEDQAAWEKTSQAQFDAAKSNIDSAMTSIGKSLAPVVLPALSDIAEGAAKLDHVFQEMPKGAKEATGAIIALLAVAGPAASLISKVATAGLLVQKLGGRGQKGVTSLSPLAGAGTSAEQAAFSRVGAIMGIRGPEMPGSIANPIGMIVMGQGAGGGAVSPIGKAAESDAVAAESKGAATAAETGLAGDAVIAGEGAAAGGVGAKILGLLKGGAGGLLRGGAIGFAGYTAASLGEAVIGGHTGHDIGTVGKDAAIGAGIGSAIPGVGTAIGAIGGALVGGITVLTHESSFGSKVADQLGKGLTPAAHKAIETAFNAQHDLTRGGRRMVPGGRGGGAGPGGLMHPHITASSAELYAGGSATAAGIINQFGGGKFPDAHRVTAAVLKDFAEIPARSRSAGIQAIVQWTAGMEANGRLPQGATEKMIASIEKRWPEYQHYLRAVGMSSVKELAETLTNGEVAAGAKKSVEEASKEFGALPPLLAEDGGNIQREWATTLDFLTKATHSKMPQVRQAAESELKKMKAGTSTLMTAWGSQMTHQFQQAGASGAAAYKTGMEGVVAAIKAAMKQGLISTQQGDKLITDETNKELTALGVVKVGSSNVKVNSSGQLHGATGMRVPGSGLLDTVPILGRRGGVRGIVAPGELLVANRHTEARIDQKLAPFGTSLAHEVLGESVPHSAPMMATGGRIVTASEFGGPSDPGSSGRTASGAINGPNLIGWAELSNPPGSLNFSALGHLPMGTMLPITYGSKTIRAPKVDVGAGGPGLAGHLRALDLTYGLAQQFGWGPSDLHDVIIGNPAGIQLPAEGAAAAFHPLTRPRWGGPGGAIGRVGRAALAKATGAANRVLRRAAAAAAASGALPGAGGTVGPASGPTGLGTFDGIPVADWIIPELLYAQRHGWHGQITSGYRPGFDPHAPSGSEHALIQYPGGAVDFGGMEDPAGLSNKLAFMAATAGYRGKRLLPAQGFRDDGHMSGTGHQLGGRVGWAGAFGHGGSATASQPTLAMFGDNGPETAVFLPHAAAGDKLLEEIGVNPAGPTKSEKAVEGLNPDNNEIEYRTPAEWRNLRLHHQQAKTKAGAKPTYEDPIMLGRMALGDVTLGTRGTINIPGDVAKLSAATWKKVVSAIEKTLKDPAGNAAFDVQATMQLVQHARENPRLRALAGKAIADTTKTVMTTAANSPSTEATKVDSTAVRQLQVLISSAQKLGNKALVTGLLKDLQKTASSWQSAIGERFSSAQSLTNVRENLKLAKANAPRAAQHLTLLTSGTDAAFLKQQEADRKGELAEMGRERGALAQAEKAAFKHHNKRLADALKAQIGEVDVAIGEAKVDVAQLQAEYQAAVYEAFKKTIEEAEAAFNARISRLANTETREEGERHLTGSDFAGLEEAKSKQEGLLTPAQIAQARADLASYTARHNEQIAEDQAQIAYDESKLGGLTGGDRTNMEAAIEGLRGSIVSLRDGIYDQTKSTEKLVESTNTLTKTFGGSVGFNFNGQDYLVGSGQSSHSGANVGVGV